MTTRVGTITLSIPRHRNGDFSTSMFERYQRSEQALVLAMIEMVINGVSTRKIEVVTEELCGKSFSKSTVSNLLSTPGSDYRSLQKTKVEQTVSVPGC